MTIEEIEQMWDKDSEIDRSELGEEALKIPQLHAKYYKIYLRERLILKKLEADMRVLDLQLREFYLDGPTKETREMGWEPPAKGRILRNDLDVYLGADPRHVELSLRIGTQHEKIAFLDSILKTIGGRNYQITNGIAWVKFTNGQ